jgi:hypothetical protein
MKEELLKGLSEEQIAKVKACKSQEEMLALARQEGVELTDEQLEAVSGGTCDNSLLVCSQCRYDLITMIERGTGKHEGYKLVECQRCHHRWWAEV